MAYIGLAKGWNLISYIGLVAWLVSYIGLVAYIGLAKGWNLISTFFTPNSIQELDYEM